MIKPPASAPLPWRRAYALGMTSLVDANAEPVISTDDEGGLIIDPDVWEFLLAAANAHTEAGAVMVPRRPDLPMDTAFIAYLNECERRNMMPTIAALWPRLLAAALKPDR